jgi:alcohol dehydrogenase class IV
VIFEFTTTGRIIFGAGALSRVGPLAASLGRRVLVMTGRDPSRAAVLLDALHAQPVDMTLFSVPGEPTTDLVRKGVQQAADSRCDLVIGFGGGSVLDAAKAVAALATNGGDPLDYIEVVGRGLALTQPSVPCIAIPTTAGTGTEVTRNAVISATEHRLKASLRSPVLTPAVALIDPELTRSLPPALTAATGLDALTQLIEPFVSLRANPLTDALCREGMRHIAGALRRAFADGGDLPAREDMALAALCSGLAMANAGLGIVHGFAGPVGGMFTAPHGAVCGCLLPHAMAANIQALRERMPAGETLRRYDEIARILTGHPAAAADDGVEWVMQLGRDLAVPPLSAYGVTGADLPALVDRTAVASSTRGNPVALTHDEMQAILLRAMS